MTGRTIKVFFALSLIVIAGFFMRDLARPGVPMLHDSNPHIARMIAYHTALHDGQLPPMWAKEVLGGIGSPVMMLNYQLPYMMSEVFVNSGVSIFNSYKIVLALSLIVSAVIMYYALATKFGNLSAWIGALIYILAPYRFVDIYVRGALGESLSFIFPPLLIWGFSSKSWPLLILGWAGLFLTHPVVTAAFSAFFLGYVLINSKKIERIEKLKSFFGPYLVALLIAAFNLLPTLALTKYTYYSPALSDTLLMFPTMAQLIHSAWGYGVSIPGINDGMSFEIGVGQWLILIWGLIAVLIYKRSELRYLIIVSLVGLFFILPISTPVYQVIHLNQVIDFPWRLLLCLVFASAWIGAELTNQLTNKLTKKLVVALIAIVLVVQSLPIAHTDHYWDRPLSWFARETGDSYGEYAPLSRSTRDSAPFGERAEFINGTGSIEIQKEKSNQQKYLVRADNDGAIRINTAYFPGWVMPDGCSVTKRTLSHIDDSGLIQCPVKKGVQTIEIKYVSPPVQRTGNLVTLIGIGVYLWILYRSFSPRLTKPTR